MQFAPTLEDILARHDWISTFTHPPDVLALFRTNEGPSPLQSARLKASLESLRTPLAKIQSDLYLLHNAIASLQDRMLRLQSFENDYKTALSPIRRVPPEITMEIVRRAWKTNTFSNCLRGRHLSGFNVFTIREGPWHLGQVCSSWRNVTERLCPELWATMTVAIPLSHEREVPMKVDMVEMLRIVLERSRNHPLHFYFRYSGTKVGEREARAMERCFHIMVSHSNRWRAVEIAIPPSLLPQLSLIHGNIDWLRDMYLDCFRGSPSGDIHAFEIAPRLEILHLKGMHPGARISFPTNNLVSFSDERPFAGDRRTLEYLDIVKSSPKLHSFSYNDYGGSLISIPFTIPDKIVSESIEELSTSSPSFMRSLVLPSLKEVTLTTMYDLDMGGELIKCPVGALGALHEMLAQSQCSLTRLCLVDVVLDNNLASIMRLMPGLQEFVVEFFEWVPDVYDPVMLSLVAQMSELSLVDGSRQHSMVPFLQTLGVYLNTIEYTHVSFINSTFVNMVASRLRRPSDAPRLTKLNLLVNGVGWSYGLDEESENALINLKSEGLELDFDLNDEDPLSESDE
ncbi:uncharacterized protein EV420DRAFT_861913 [Desarmillaria tabescens]|uniref:F-box domain-containing protein n=1 Tax=Armillaria tabescens TaxID=1929756 RepID=A0AA39MUS2_ARMTA|nr:uncharacterized protein EV420DRAFT_861913 [Desarmillaria tabescens]KAK0447841.1 hypothetical protein EV420DRAFT_861913 [Desarmillaria tabescens]